MKIWLKQVTEAILINVTQLKGRFHDSFSSPLIGDQPCPCSTTKSPSLFNRGYWFWNLNGKWQSQFWKRMSQVFSVGVILDTKYISWVILGGRTSNILMDKIILNTCYAHDYSVLCCDHTRRKRHDYSKTRGHQVGFMGIPEHGV